MQYGSKKNKTVLLTRQHSDNAALKGLLEKNDITVLEESCFEIAYVEPLDEEIDKLKSLDEFDAVVFSSKNGVTGFFVWLESQHELRNQGRPRLVGAVGPKTAEELKKHKWRADVVADPATGKELADRLLKIVAPAANVLAIRGNTSRDVSSKELVEKGCTICSLTVYENREPEVEKIAAFYDLVVYTSPSGVERFVKKNPAARDVKAVALGTTTKQYLDSINIDAIASDKTDENALLETILKVLRKQTEE